MCMELESKCSILFLERFVLCFHWSVEGQYAFFLSKDLHHRVKGFGSGSVLWITVESIIYNLDVFTVLFLVSTDGFHLCVNWVFPILTSSIRDFRLSFRLDLPFIDFEVNLLVGRCFTIVRSFVDIDSVLYFRLTCVTLNVLHFKMNSLDHLIGLFELQCCFLSEVVCLVIKGNLFRLGIALG